MSCLSEAVAEILSDNAVDLLGELRLLVHADTGSNGKGPKNEPRYCHCDTLVNPLAFADVNANMSFGDGIDFDCDSLVKTYELLE